MSDGADLTLEFERKSVAAIAGNYLPTDAELMSGMPFYEDDVASDIAEWGRVRAADLRELADDEAVRRHLRLLDGLIMHPGEGAIERLLAGEDPELAWYEAGTRPSMLRARIYLAHFNVPEHMAFVAGELAKSSLSQEPHTSYLLFVRALAWSALCRVVQERGRRRAMTDFATYEAAFRLKCGATVSTADGARG